MAHSFPENLPSRVTRDPKRAAELRLFNQLRTQLGGEWVVFYSVAWLGRFRSDGALHDGETDFIVAHPSHGVLLIEVKGGRIAYDGGLAQWTTTDREGGIHSINPFAQARKCKYDLRDKIRSLPGWGDEHILLGHAVAFPDTVLNPSVALPPDAPPDIILDAHDLDRLPQRLEQIMGYWCAENLVAPFDTARGKEFIQMLIRLLAPTTTLPNPLSVQIADEEREILRLTAEQYRLLDFLGRTRRAAISGAAGSGKTMMAVEKAKRLAREGFRVLLTCYNSPLGAHLQRAFDADVKGGADIFVSTFHQWCSHAARQAGLVLPMVNGVPAWEEYPEMLLAALEARPELRVDAVILDEAQDMEELWWLALAASLRDRADSVFYAFYDDNQRVRRSNGIPIPIDLDLQPFALHENVRNTRTIHKLASGFYQGSGPSEPRGPSGRTVEMFSYTDEAMLRKELSRLLHRFLVVEAVPPGQIAVLTPRSEEESAVSAILSTLGTQHRQVVFAPIDRFKGLEQSVVIVAELDSRFASLPERERDALAYVAFSRPRNHLALLGDTGLLASLQ